MVGTLWPAKVLEPTCRSFLVAAASVLQLDDSCLRAPQGRGGQEKIMPIGDKFFFNCETCLPRTMCTKIPTCGGLSLP